VTLCGTRFPVLPVYALRNRPPIRLNIRNMLSICSGKAVVALIIADEKKIFGMGRMHRRL
jgi:hypothetical protein